MYKRISAIALALCALPALALAHEVYVLPPEVVAAALSSPSPNPILAFFGNEGRFFFWGAVAIILTLTIFFASTFRHLEQRTTSIFAHLKRYAHPLVRFTVGITLVVFGTTNAYFGPELSFDQLFGGANGPMQIVVLLIGVGILLGFQTRVLSFAALLIFAYATSTIGMYALNYVQHAAAYIFLIIMGGGPWTIDHHFHLGWKFRKHLEHYSPYAFPLMRVGLGASIMFAAFYAKFLHSNLALQVIERYQLDAFFPFDPLFIVLGAFIVEFLAGLMLVLGFEIRWTALFLVFWLTLAHLYFPEPVWVHLSLYGLGLALICHGYDRFTIEGRLFKRKKMEPAL